MNIFEKNEEILKEWKASNEKNNEFNFAPDGIMFRGDFVDYEGGTTRLPSDDGRENDAWEDASPRILFLTKDQNSGGDDAWDARGETINFSYAFYRNLSYQLYGLVNTTDISKANFEFSYDDAADAYNNYPFARINVKKEAGSNSINNSTLRSYLERDAEFIIRQIENLNPDIIVCCGYSESIEESGNLILNFLNHNGFNFVKATDDNWMYYDEKRNVLAINDWHLSVRTSPETIYTQMINAYFDFLQHHPDFADARIENGRHSFLRSQINNHIFSEIKKLIEEKGCSDKVSVDNE